MPNSEGRPTRVMCVDCAGLGRIEVLVEPNKVCGACEGSGQIVRGVDVKLVKLQKEVERLHAHIENIRRFMEYDAEIFLTDENRFDGIGAVLKDYYEALGESE